MKKIFTLVCGLAGIFAVSCQDPFKEPEKEPEVIGDPTKIVIEATTQTQVTRLAVEEDIIHTKWSDGDQIGIFMRFEEDEWFGADRFTLVPNSIDKTGTTADFGGTLEWQGAKLPHYFYAYAPKIQNDEVEGEKIDADPTAIPLKLPAAQTQDRAGNEFISKYNFMVAETVQVTSPRSFVDPEQAKKVDINLRSAFSILEFRFASFQDPTLNEVVKVQKITLSSEKRPLAMENGTIDLTKANYASNFAITSADEDQWKKEITLDITNPLQVPVTLRKNVIEGNKSREPADLDVVFPARFVVLPNMSAPLAWGEEENWDITVYFTVNGVEKTQTRKSPSRTLKPGERHSIPFVLLVKDGSTGPVEPEEPGDPWDGTTKTQPVINDTEKIITIKTPAELAWLSDAINSQTLPADFEQKTPRLYEKYTIKIEENINLNDKEWIPIGYNDKRAFRGTVDGGGHLISGLKISPVVENIATDYKKQPGNSEFIYIGLFGYLEHVAEGSGIGGLPIMVGFPLKDLRVKGNISLSKEFVGSFGMINIGGIAGAGNANKISNCGFEGTMVVNLNASNNVGAIIGQTSGSITECWSTANVKLYSSLTTANAYSRFGGITGTCSTIKGCDFGGAIEAEGHWMVGGIVASGGSIKACRNTGNITVSGNDDAIGGIAGVAGGNIMACYNTGTLTVDDGYTGGGSSRSIGGIIGAINSTGSSVKACYNRGKINPGKEILQRTGNIVGYYYLTAASASFYEKISENYYVREEFYTDILDVLPMNAVLRFTSSQWPQTSMDGWGTGDGSADNKYWNVIFPDSYGVEDWEYPQLYWEVIE